MSVIDPTIIYYIFNEFINFIELPSKLVIKYKAYSTQGEKALCNKTVYVITMHIIF